MEPSSGNTQEDNSDTISRQLTENDDEQRNGSSENLIQAPENRLVYDVDTTRNMSNSVNELQSNSEIDNCTPSVSEPQESLQENEKPIDEQTLVEEITTMQPQKKTAKEKAAEDILKIIKNLSIIFAYPSKNKSKQPFVVQPPGESGSGVPPRPIQPPRPPVTPAVVPQRPDGNQPQRGDNTTTTQQPRPVPAPTQRGGQTGPSPAVPIFIDPLPMYAAGPAYFVPAAFYNSVVWAPVPSKLPPNTPNSLAHLVVTDSFYVAQISWFDYFSDLEEFFIVQNKNGECLYFVYETMDFGDFALCESLRGYRLHFLDMYHSEVIFMSKLSGCNSCCCCYPEMLVHAPPGTPVGAVTKKCNFNREEYALLGPDRNRMFKMLGPCCATCCCWTLEADFTIHALDSQATEVGCIRREAGFIRSYAGSEFFLLQLPMDMDVKVKALFLGAVFLTVR